MTLSHITLDGGTDDTPIGNIGDSLKTIVGGSQADAFGRQRVSGVDIVEGVNFSNGPHTLLFSQSLAGSATIALNTSGASMRLSTTTNASDSAILQTKRYFRYTPGLSHLVSFSGTLGAAKTNVRQRIGYFDSNNGLFFEQTSTGLKVVLRSSTSGSPVDTAVAQSGWNMDKLDGTGSSGITLDTSKHNLYLVDFVWHGAGIVRFGIHHGGRIIYCHQFETGNVNTAPFMRRPSQPMRVELTNTGTAASGTTLDFVCFSYQKETVTDDQGYYYFSSSNKVTKKSINSTTPLPLISIRPKTSFQGSTNRIPIKLEEFEVLSIQDTVYIQVLLNPTLTGASFVSVDANSAVETDLSATAVSGGTIVFETFATGGGKGNSSLASLVNEIFIGLDIAGSVQDTLTIACAKINGNSDAVGIIGWSERQ